MRLAVAIGDVNVGYFLPEYTAYPYHMLPSTAKKKKKENKQKTKAKKKNPTFDLVLDTKKCLLF